MDKARTKSGNLTNVVAYALIGCIAFVVMKFVPSGCLFSEPFQE